MKRICQILGAAIVGVVCVILLPLVIVFAIIASVLEKSPCSNREHKHYDWNGLAYGALLESLPERGKAD